MGRVMATIKNEISKNDPKVQLIAKVQSVEPDYVVLATERGTKRIYTKVSYKVGDTVRLQGDVILGPIQASGELPVFKV